MTPEYKDSRVSARAPIPDREYPLRAQLGVLAKQVLDANNQRVGVDGRPVTFGEARSTYFDLLYLIRTPDDVRDVRGIVRHFPRAERPLFITTETAYALNTRYELQYRAFGNEAITALGDIAAGKKIGRRDLIPERVPIGDVVNVLGETFDIEVTRDTLVTAIAARQDRYKAIVDRKRRFREITGRQRITDEPEIGSFQDVEVITDAVVELPRLQSEEIPQTPKVASTLVDVIKFSADYDLMDLSTRSASSLLNFALMPTQPGEPSNASLLSGQRQSLEQVRAQLAKLPERASAIRSIEEVLSLIPPDEKSGDQAAEEAAAAIGDRFRAFQRGTEKGYNDAVGVYSDEDRGAEENHNVAGGADTGEYPGLKDRTILMDLSILHSKRKRIPRRRHRPPEDSK